MSSVTIELSHLATANAIKEYLNPAYKRLRKPARIHPPAAHAEPNPEDSAGVRYGLRFNRKKSAPAVFVKVTELSPPDAVGLLVTIVQLFVAASASADSSA